MAAMNSFANSENSFFFEDESFIDSVDEDGAPEIPEEADIISFPSFLTNTAS